MGRGSCAQVRGLLTCELGSTASSVDACGGSAGDGVLVVSFAGALEVAGRAVGFAGGGIFNTGDLF
jgi:hypothetical protein